MESATLVTLAEAREKANELRKAVKVEKRDVLAERKDEAAAKVTFREAATQYHSENEAGWKSAVYARQWLASLENYAFPKLGDMPTGSIAAADIIDVLMPIWQEIPETARQVCNRICAVLDYAHAKGWRSTEAPSGNSSLKAGRGLPRQIKKAQNRKSMPWRGPAGVSPPPGGVYLQFREREGEALGVPSQGSRQRSAQTTAPFQRREAAGGLARAIGAPAGVRQ